MIVFFIFTANASELPENDDDGDIYAERLIFNKILKQILSENDYPPFEKINSRQLRNGNYTTIN